MATQRTPLFNPNDTNIPEHSKTIGSDGNIYIKIKEKNKNRYRWKKIICKEMNDEYFQTRINCIKYSAKRWGLSKIKTSRTLIAFTPMISDPMMKLTLFDLSHDDYYTYLLFTFLDYHKINPFELFGLNDVSSGLSDRSQSARRTHFVVNPARITKVISRFYPKIDFNDIPNDGKTGILLYIAMKGKLFK